MNSRSLLLNAYVYAVLAFVLVPIVIILPMAFSDTNYLTFRRKASPCTGSATSSATAAG